MRFVTVYTPRTDNNYPVNQTASLVDHTSASRTLRVTLTEAYQVDVDEPAFVGDGGDQQDLGTAEFQLNRHTRPEVSHYEMETILALTLDMPAGVSAGSRLRLVGVLELHFDVNASLAGPKWDDIDDRFVYNVFVSGATTLMDAALSSLPMAGNRPHHPITNFLKKVSIDALLLVGSTISRAIDFKWNLYWRVDGGPREMCSLDPWIRTSLIWQTMSFGEGIPEPNPRVSVSETEGSLNLPSSAASSFGELSDLENGTV